MARTVIALDTNVLLLMGQRHLDVFSLIDEAMREPYELVVPSPVLAELEKLGSGRSKDARAAKLARVLVEQKAEESKPGLMRRLLRSPTIPLKIVRSSEAHADDALLAIADGAVLATLDRGLQRRVKGRARVLSVQGKRFAFQG